MSEAHTANRLVSVEELLESDYPMGLAYQAGEPAEMFDGCCPCGWINGEGFRVDFHCWRSCCEHGCEYSGIHVTGTPCEATLWMIALHIRDNNGWADSTEWNVTVVRHD